MAAVPDPEPLPRWWQRVRIGYNIALAVLSLTVAGPWAALLTKVREEGTLAGAWVMALIPLVVLGFIDNVRRVEAAGADPDLWPPKLRAAAARLALGRRHRHRPRPAGRHRRPDPHRSETRMNTVTLAAASQYTTMTISTAGFALGLALLGTELWRWHKGGAKAPAGGPPAAGGGGGAKDPKALIPLGFGIFCGILMIACPAGILGTLAQFLRWGGNSVGDMAMRWTTGVPSQTLAPPPPPASTGTAPSSSPPWPSPCGSCARPSRKRSAASGGRASSSASCSA
ncbi:hypothetical protein [Streptomyces sp. SGAir0957]